MMSAGRTNDDLQQKLMMPAERPSVRAMASTLERLWLMLAIVMRSSG
ncbi:hypothetical protein RR42_s0926 [Cupriavidus basilensis]|uniref:Uncharacterized protein n=1 Tax=Cupriavidus basilensis TaxID=68895 RepID=A0A0C4YPK7_9BURK|nr:hypothetical protein RR42_s0926 [Cupriavidus basilensis]